MSADGSAAAVPAFKELAVWLIAKPTAQQEEPQLLQEPWPG